MEDLEASSWIEFMDIVQNQKNQLSDNDQLWYRGQSRTDYRLIPSLLRLPDGTIQERALFNEYKRNAARLKMDQKNDWHFLADMQHYGIPTRLLDWTQSLGTALTFAMLDGADNEDSAIYLLNPSRLNAASKITGIRRVPSDSYEYQGMYLDGIPLTPRTPVAIDCELRNPRISAQNGTFTVHGSDLHPFDDDAIVYGSKIVLRASAKKGARQFLEFADLNEFSIYPDIVGMAGYLKRKYFS